MKRRHFIKLSATATAIGLLPFELKAMLKQININPCDFSNRKLVLVNLAGGNDGLNTIVPLNQYDVYSNLRPNIHVPETGSSKYITLDNTLDASQQVGLNPAMVGFKSLYDRGWLRVIQGVGYPSQNKSHFASTDIYLTGNDGNSWTNGNASGFMGRYMELFYQSELNESYPLAIQIGSKTTSLGLHGATEHGMALNITGQDVSGFYSVLTGLGGSPPQTIPSSHYGEALDFIIETDRLSNQYSQGISNAFNSGSNNTSYPDTDLANQLKTVAKLISGGLQSKVYLVRISGFDTHNEQVQGMGDPIGKHHDLLSELSSAIEVFFNDLEGQGLADDVVGITFSEFGRKAGENGNLGTDHGEISPMFVFGKPIQGGVSGINPDLTEATEDNNFQIKTVQHDYRDTFGTILQNFLGADDTIIDNTFFNNTARSSFTTTKINDLIKAPYSVPEACYNNVLGINDIIENENIKLYPNPFKSEITIESNQNLNDFDTYEVFNLSGQRVYKGNITLNRVNLLSINLKSLSPGAYLFRINSSKGLNSKSFKIIKQQ